jgi:hypothetical protein
LQQLLVPVIYAVQLVPPKTHLPLVVGVGMDLAL